MYGTVVTKYAERAGQGVPPDRQRNIYAYSRIMEKRIELERRGRPVDEV